ncbi:MAG: rRNA maturation RNase YbeY [Bacteroidales bacterium]
MPVYFHAEETNFELKDQKTYGNWIKKIVGDQQKTIQTINIIFTSNDLLLKINREYLKHNYFTDVITFNYNDEETIAGDIFVSVDQVKINGEENNVTFYNELCRVMIHGVLHLLGFNDETKSEAEEIRKMENMAIEVLEEMKDG